MDEKTLILVNILISILFAILMTLLWMRQRRVRIPGQWVVSEWLTPIALLSALLYSFSGNSAWVACSALLYWMIFINHLEALRRFSSTPDYSRLLFVLGFLFSLVITYISVTDFNLAARITAVSLAFGVLSMIVVAALVQRNDREERPLYWIMISVFACHALFHFGRSLAASPAWAWRPLPEYVMMGSFYLELLLFKVVTDLAIIALVIQRLQNRLNYLAHHDDLTELPNRRFLVALAERELAQARRSGRICSVLMLDLDHFKKINDRFGHAAGDRALFLFALWTRRILRQGDFLARIGGEEFCAFLPDTDEKAAVEVAERLRAAVASKVVIWEDKKFAISTSIGVASTTGRGEEIDSLLRTADQALYRAKMLGRNTVVPSSE